MRGFMLSCIVVSALLAGCAQRLPKPPGLSLFVSHNYVISTKNSQGSPVEGVRFQLAKADLATVFTHDELARFHETVSTNSNGVAEVSVSAQLAQHWKGGHYKLENEAEIERQAFPHGGKDIWGYFTEVRADGFVATRFSNGSNAREFFPVDVLVKTPASYGSSAEHRYHFQATDISGKPVGGARVTLSAADYSHTNGDLQKIKATQGSFDCVTNQLGLCSVMVPVKSGAFYMRDFPDISEAKPFEWLYKSNLPGLHFGYFSGGSAVAAMPGFFESSSLRVERATYSGVEPDSSPLKVVVPQPSDYFCQALKTPESANFARNLDSWVRAIRVSSWAQKADLS